MQEPTSNLDSSTIKTREFVEKKDVPRKLNKTFTDFHTSTINSQDLKKKGTLAVAEKKSQAKKLESKYASAAGPRTPIEYEGTELDKSIGNLLSIIDEDDWYNRIQHSQSPKSDLAKVSQSKIIAGIRQQ